MFKLIKILIKKNRNIFLALLIPLDFFRYYKRNWAPPVPTLIKHKTIERNLIKNSILIETGTLFGDLILSLGMHFSKCYTIEASEEFYKIAKKNLSKIKNVEVLNNSSDSGLRIILKKNYKYITFYLDAHYSGFGTFKNNNQKSVVERELEVIQEYLHKLNSFVIIIDDFRCFGEDRDYPKKEYIFNFAIKNNLNFFIENDTFIITKN